MRNIQHLPESVHSSVRSGIILSDLTRVVEELIFNSLDAGASKISVAVGVGTCYAKVVDNGSGITRDGLVLLGERYATSKLDQPDGIDAVTGGFGCRGESLSSISDVSLLEIITKSHGRPNGYRKVIKGCKCMYLGIDDNRQDVGTTVIVRDLYYNQPVRRKHMQSSPKKVLHSVKKCVLRIALVHPEVLFKVIDTESENELLCTYPSRSPLSLLTSGFGSEVSNTLHELNVSDGALKLSGYLSAPRDTFSNGIRTHPHCNEDFILDISSGLLHLAGGESLVPKSVTKKLLEDAKVLQQVDKKFIPVVSGGVLALIDQHAADERIRLEELRQKVLSGEMKTITYLDAEQELVLPEIGNQLLHIYAEQIQSWGWICNIHAQASRSFKMNLNLLHRHRPVVTLLAVPCILGVNLTDVDLLEFLQQLADTDGSSTMPPSVLRVLNFKACRGAIMFGDTLLPSECSLIVEELKQTSLCFQCAHGRPTTAPLVNLGALHKQIAKHGLLNGGSNEPWHGLLRHEVSLERAAMRFTSSGGPS